MYDRAGSALGGPCHRLNRHLAGNRLEGRAVWPLQDQGAAVGDVGGQIRTFEPLANPKRYRGSDGAQPVAPFGKNGFAIARSQQAVALVQAVQQRSREAGTTHRTTKLHLQAARSWNGGESTPIQIHVNSDSQNRILDLAPDN